MRDYSASAEQTGAFYRHHITGADEKTSRATFVASAGQSMSALIVKHYSVDLANVDVQFAVDLE